MPRNVEIGAIVEIRTNLGYAYAQYSHYHEAPPRYGALLRVLPGIFQERPKNFKDLAEQKESFAVFFPLQAAINRGIFQVVAQEAVPSHARAFPLFRAGNVNPTTGKVEQWWLWNGGKSWKIEQLSDEQLDLPIKEICNDLALIERIQKGWTPRKAEALMQVARLSNTIKKSSTIRRIRHFLVFKNLEDALRASREASEAGFKFDIVNHGSGASLVVQQGFPLTEEYVEHVTLRLTDIARNAAGTYDAWETEQ